MFQQATSPIPGFIVLPFLSSVLCAPSATQVHMLHGIFSVVNTFMGHPLVDVFLNVSSIFSAVLAACHTQPTLDSQVASFPLIL